MKMENLAPRSGSVWSD